MTYPGRFLLVDTLLLASCSGCLSPLLRAQPADETVAAMNARFAGATVAHVGASLPPTRSDTP